MMRESNKQKERAYDHKAWLKLTDSYELGSYVFGQATYNRMLRCFKRWVSASQDHFNLLEGLLENGERKYQEGDLLIVRGLLAEGVLAIRGKDDGTCIVDISSPLLRTTIRRKCSIVDQVVEPPPTTICVDRKWVVLQAIKTLDGDLMDRPECLNADGQSSSEYIHQFFFMCRVKTILRQAYPHCQIFVLHEVKEQ
ncbi:hypothetical protein GOP47_0028320 [Adiantum capillus-veneris]|nr:hypothetical protein GOP47_0028320 [Adiantum capillus-veneris]